MWNDLLGEEDFPELDKVVFDTLFRWCRLTEPGPGNGKVLKITHTTAVDIKFQYFFDGFLLDESSFLLGCHLFVDESGREYRFPVIFGSNISNDNVRPERRDDSEGLRDAWVCDLRHQEVAGECIKEYDNETVWYSCFYKLPETVKTLHYVKFEPAAGKDAAVRVAKFSLL